MEQRWDIKLGDEKFKTQLLHFDKVKLENQQN